ncbi:hypothetical protein EON63_09135 [archaeon]|nr:MAG: hypothetical protein EON63_09135 [archaeon]
MLLYSRHKYDEKHDRYIMVFGEETASEEVREQIESVCLAPIMPSEEMANCTLDQLIQVPVFTYPYLHLYTYISTRFIKAQLHTSWITHTHIQTHLLHVGLRETRQRRRGERSDHMVCCTMHVCFYLHVFR